MIQFGNDKIKEIYYGSDKIKEVYHGGELVWSGKKISYAILTNGTRVNFEFENTPMSNLETTATSITLNGTSYQKITIKEITFGISYEHITSIGNQFINNFHSLLSIDLSVFVNVTSIGYAFINNCSSLPSIDLSAFVNVTSISNAFLAQCGALNILYIGTIIPPTLASNSFYNSPIQNIYVPAQSVNAYKTATNWNSYANKISAI